MRATVLVSEYLTYIPAAVTYVRPPQQSGGVGAWESSIALAAILMQPSIILIDHAHFQYNTVMLGLVLASIHNLIAGRLLWASLLFVGALGFKQMALYYAPAVFAYLLGICVFPRINFSRFISIALITLASFAITFLPLVLGALYDAHYSTYPTTGTESYTANPVMASLPFTVDSKKWYFPIILQLTQAVHRVFPFARGLFEDKVANIWCAIHTVHKLHQYPLSLLQRLSLGATVVAILPACVTIFLCPRKDTLPLALASTAWGFFLCSFQVHEKSVLLPLLPMTLLLSGRDGLSAETRAWVGWANTLASWTLFPLLKRDNLRVPYFVLTLLFTYLLGLPPTSFSAYFGYQSKASQLSIVTKIVHLGFYAAMIVWHILEAFVQTPKGKPDLWTVINVLIGAAGFGICYLWCTWKLFERSGLFDGYVFGGVARDTTKEKSQ